MPTVEIVKYRNFRKHTILIDSEDYSRLLAMGVRALFISGNGSVHCRHGKPGAKKQAIVARLVLNYDGPLVVDHINRNPLDNRKCNLRLASRAQNHVNSHHKKEIRSCPKYKGISLTTDGTYCAKIKFSGVKYHLGTFKTQELAAFAYNVATQYAYPDFGLCNKLPANFIPPDGMATSILAKISKTPPTSSQQPL